MRNQKAISDSDRKQDYGDILSSGIYALRTTFRHAPGGAGIYTALSLTGSVCSVTQILILQRLVDEVCRYVRNAGSGNNILLWGILYIGAMTVSSLYGFARDKLDWYLRRRLTKSLTPAIVE